MNIEELPALLAKLEDRAGEQEAMRATMLEIGTTLADLLQLLERSGPDTAKAIAAALAGLKLGEIQANVNVPQPLVQIMPAQPVMGWTFEHKYDAKGRATQSIATPIMN